MSKDKNLGMGDYQKFKENKAKRAIFQVLIDGNWHRYKEIQDQTKLSSYTVSRHLKKMTTIQMIDRKVDSETKEYPKPVLYKAIPEVITYISSFNLRKDFTKVIQDVIEETKDPIIILDQIHLFSQTIFLKILGLIQKENIADDQIEFLEEIAWGNYQSMTFDLINTTKRIIKNVDLNKSLVAQAKRQIEIYQSTLDRYIKLGLNK